ncbi:MAG: ABC transporter substrate-binding protein [Pseudomonadota bacterium]
MKRSRSQAAFLLAGVLSSSVAMAQPPLPLGSPGWNGFDPAASYPIQTANDPATWLEQGVNRMLVFLKDKDHHDTAVISAFLDQEVAPAFDFEGMARQVAGSQGAGMSDTDWMQLAVNLKKSFLGSLVQHLAGYSNQSIHFITPRMGRDGEMIVTALVRNPGRQYPHRLQFHLHAVGNGWKIHDVAANGSSAVIFYRDQFFRMNGMSDRRPMPPRF